MEQRQLGKDGPTVPVLGLGAWPLGGGMGAIDDQMAAAVIHAALDHGVTLIDTAQAYLASEERIGRALRGGHRARCFLATKVSGDYSRRGIRAAMENSLKALGVDYVDLYQVHTRDHRYPLAETMETMERLRQEGKTRYLGVSNFDAEQMRQALTIARFHSTQPVYNLFERGIETQDLPFCAQAGIGVLAHSPLAKGLLTERYRAPQRFPADDERSHLARFQGAAFGRHLAAATRLGEIAHGYGLTLPQLAIAWLLRTPVVTCVLFGAKSVAQVAANVRAASVTFSAQALAKIEAALP